MAGAHGSWVIGFSTGACGGCVSLGWPPIGAAGGGGGGAGGCGGDPGAAGGFHTGTDGTHPGQNPGHTKPLFGNFAMKAAMP